MIRTTARLRQKSSAGSERKAVSIKAFGLLDPEASLHPSVKLGCQVVRGITYQFGGPQRQTLSSFSRSTAESLPWACRRGGCPHMGVAAN